jgi:hypothetical protein
MQVHDNDWWGLLYNMLFLDNQVNGSCCVALCYFSIEERQHNKKQITHGQLITYFQASILVSVTILNE